MKPASRSAPSLFALVLVVGAFAGCPSPTPLDDAECGPDTTLVDGACVSSLTPTTCGEGSVLDEASGECVPTTTCAPGTTLDPATQQCVGDTSCGPGTTLDPTTGACIGDVDCGPGTVYDPRTRRCIAAASCADGTELDAVTQQCVPVNRCGPGTIRDSVTNLCVAEISCGPGLVVDDGRCVSADDLLLADADAIEPGNDQNDPAFGGTPEALELEGAGEAVIFAGTIGRPVDIDADGANDQDRDFWQFTATGSTTLRVQVLSLGLPSPAFRITGPEGFVRDSRRGDLEPLREVILPRSGDYTIEVSTVGAFDNDNDGDGVLVGSPNHGYLGVIEEIPFPASRDLTLAPLPTFTSVTGSLLDLTNNAVHLRGAASTGAMWTTTVVEGGTVPVVLVFDGDRRFLQEIEFTRTSQVLQPLTRPAWLQDVDDAIVVVDWRTSSGADSAFTVVGAALPTTELGIVQADSLLERPRVSIPGQFGRSFTFTMGSPGSVLRSSFAGAGAVNALLVGPAGVIDTATTLVNVGHAALLDEAGAYVWVVVNATTSDVNVSPGLQAVTPIDGGALVGDGSVQRFSGADLIPRRRFGDRVFILATTAEPTIVTTAASYAFGMADLELFTVDPLGALKNRRFKSEDSVIAIAADVVEPSRILIALDQGTIEPPNPAVRDWEVTLQATTPPTLTEVEPNDDNATATTLQAPPAVGTSEVRGTIVDDEFDRYRLELPTPLVAGEALSVQVRNLTLNNATPLRVFNDADVKISDASDTVVTGTLILPGDGPGPFIIELEGTGTTPYDYVLVAERIGVLSEAEPNDSVAAATVVDVTNLPVEIVGSSRSTDADHYTFTLSEPLPAGFGLKLRARNEVETDDLDLTLRSATNTVLSTTRHEDGVLIQGTGSETTFSVEVRGRASTRPEIYRLTIDVINFIELEPNNDFATATPLGINQSLFGQGVLNAVDFYRVDLDTPLGAGKTLKVRWDNLLERGDITVRVFSSTQELIQLNKDYSSEIVFGAPGDAGPFFVSVTPTGSSTNVRPEPYLVELSRIDAVSEREPNNDVATAQPITSGDRLFGHSRSSSSTTNPNGDVDVYRVVVGASGELVVEASAVHRLDDLIVSVTDAGGTVLAAGVDIDHTLVTSAPPGSTVTVSVQSTQTTTDRFRLYTLLATSE